jgi:hypothetical protein
MHLHPETSLPKRIFAIFILHTAILIRNAEEVANNGEPNGELKGKIGDELL